MTTVETRLGIHLDVHCDYEECTELAGPLLEQLQSGRYDEMSVVNLQPVSHWRDDHRTARKRADMAKRFGYHVGIIDPKEWTESINAVNLSTDHRQGRPMSAPYRQRQEFSSLPHYSCSRHRIRWFGVFMGWDVLAYAVIYRTGELALVSQILGHADKLRDGIMYLLMQDVMRLEYDSDPHGYLVYNRHDSGTDGLRFYKERCGFVPMQVAWCP